MSTISPRRAAYQPELKALPRRQPVTSPFQADLLRNIASTARRLETETFNNAARDLRVAALRRDVNAYLKSL